MTAITQNYTLLDTCYPAALPAIFQRLLFASQSSGEATSPALTEFDIDSAFTPECTTVSVVEQVQSNSTTTAAPRSQQHDGLTALHLACLVGNKDFVEAILRRRMDAFNAKLRRAIDQHSDGNRSAAEWAARGNSGAAIHALFVSGAANLTSPNDRGETPLYVAAKSGNADALDALIHVLPKSELDVELPFTSGETPIQAAAKLGHAHCMRLLAEAGASTYNVVVKSDHEQEGDDDDSSARAIEVQESQVGASHAREPQPTSTTTKTIASAQQQKREDKNKSNGGGGCSCVVQ